MSSSAEIYRTMLLSLLQHTQFMNVSRTTLVAHPTKDKVAVIIDPRFDDLMEAVIRNFMYFLSQQGYNLMIISDARYSAVVHQKFPQCIFVPLDPQMVYEDERGVPNLSRDVYNHICTSEEFWTHVPGEQVVIFQKDCIMYHMFPEHYSQVFDFCGANYFHPRDCAPRYGGINGGLSFRRRSVMLECIQKIRIETILRYRRVLQKKYTFHMESNITEDMMKLLLPMNEDIFFSHACELLNKRVPDTFHRSYFAVEADANPDTAGYHGWDKEHHPADIAIMLLTKSEFWNQRIAQCNMKYYLQTQGLGQGQRQVYDQGQRQVYDQGPISDIRMPPPPHPQSYMPPMRPIQHQASEIRIEPLSPPSNCNLSSSTIPYRGGMGVSFSGTICTEATQRVVSPTTVTPIGVQSLNNHVLVGLTQMYYINLDRCTQRRKYMETLVKHPIFSGVNVERISACDGSRDNIDNFLEFELPYEKSSEVTSLEYACTISHFRAIEAFSMTDSSKVPFALIVEDDLSLDFVPHWKRTLQEYMDQCPYKWEVLQLSYIPVEAVIDRHIEYDAWNITKNICGASAYLMTHAAATKFMTNIKSQYSKEGPECRVGPLPQERFPQGQSRKETSSKYCIGPNTRGIVTYKADWLIYSLMRTYTVNPPLFTYRDQNDSNIHPEHVIHQAAAKNRTQKLFL